MEKLTDALEGVPDWLATLSGFFAVVLLAIIFALLGGPVLLPVLMLLPVAFVALSAGEQPASALAVFSALTWLVAALPRGGQAATPLWEPVTNALIGLLVFLGAAYALQQYRVVLLRERACAHEDPLTGLPNLRGFFELAQREITRSKRNLTPVSVAYLGLENLAKVVESHGQKAADAILKQLGHSLVTNTRGTDVSARIGESDFVLLMSETGIDGGIKGIRRVYDLLMETVEELSMPVSFCVGLVTYNILPDSIEGMLAEADALHQQTRLPGSDRIKHHVVDL